MAPDSFAVTVAIPAYNEGRRIAAAIAAARAQSEPAAEILVVDDGSSDDTAAVARAAGARVVVQPNAGVAEARNTAIREAASEWIAFCDADDTFHPDKLACARAAHERCRGADFMFTDYAMNVEGRITVRSTFELVPDIAANVTERLGGEALFFSGEALAKAIAGTNFVIPSTVVVRRPFLLENHVFFDPNLPKTPDYFVSEDIEWFLRILRFGDAIGIDRVLTEHRRKPGSVSEDSGRTKYGDVVLGEIIAAAPDRYPPELGAAFRFHRRRHVREAALYHARALRFAEARAKLREAQSLAFKPGDEALYVLATLAALPGGRRSAEFLRSAWRKRTRD